MSLPRPFPSRCVGHGCSSSTVRSWSLAKTVLIRRRHPESRAKLAVQIAKILARDASVAAGRIEHCVEHTSTSLARLDDSPRQTDEELIAAFRREAAKSAFDVIIDYLWGHPTKLSESHPPEKNLPIGESETSTGGGG